MRHGKLLIGIRVLAFIAVTMQENRPKVSDVNRHFCDTTYDIHFLTLDSRVAQRRDIPAIARKLDVQIVADGTVRQIQNHLHVISRVIDADGFQIWSERFETEADPHWLFKLPEKIVSALVNSIRSRTVLDPETERLSTGGDPLSYVHDNQQIGAL